MYSTIKSSTLVMPSVSMANVPQLAADLFVHTLGFVKVGALDSTYLYPFISPVDTAGSSSNPTPGVSTALEVFYSEKQNLTLLHQRSPVIPSFCQTHIDKVVHPFITSGEFEKIIILDSTDAGLSDNPGSIQKYSNGDLSLSLESLKLQTAIDLKETTYQHSLIAAKLINNFKDSDISIDVLVMAVYEGDNFHDGEVLARETAEFLNLDVDSWKKPVSWLGAYGDKPVPSAMEEGIYG